MTSQQQTLVRRKDTGRAGNGGEFDSHRRDDATITLGVADERERDWGTVSVLAGSRTPWGPAQHVERIADGISFASCAGHGGIKVSAERNRQIPAPLRNSGGWYEEDCEYLIVARTFPEAFQSQSYWAAKGADDTFAEADAAVRRWFPDGWEKVTGGTVQPGESSVRDRAVFHDAHADDFIGVPQDRGREDGMLIVHAERRSDGARRTFLVTAEDREAQKAHPERGQEHGLFVVDETRHQVAPMPRKPPRLERPVDATFNLGMLTRAENQRAHNELAKRWRTRDGRIVTGAELIAEHQPTRKYVSQDNQGRSVFYLQNDHNQLLQVSAALYKASPLPTEDTRAEAARRALTRAEDARDRDPGSKSARARLDRAKLAYAAARDAEEAERAARTERWKNASTPDRFDSDLAETMGQLRAGGWLRLGRDGLDVIDSAAPAQLLQRVEDLTTYGQSQHLFSV